MTTGPKPLLLYGEQEAHGRCRRATHQGVDELVCEYGVTQLAPETKRRISQMLAPARGFAYTSGTESQKVALTAPVLTRSAP